MPVNESAVSNGEDASREVRVTMVSLGCPKNLVDSEVMLGNLGSRGLVVTHDADDADIILVNTCGFIDSAKEESIQSILEACELKRKSRKPKKVVVTGCLGQRYGRELEKEIPELDAIVGLGEYGNLADTLLDLTRNESETIHYQVSDPTKSCNAEVGRFRLTPGHYAYIRMSEGCDNPCTFCAIPAIRGRFRSKPIPMILEEARELVASGAREIVLISQDTTSYGVDLDGKFHLHRLLEELARVEGVEWIRLLYAYPAYMTDEMIEAIASIPQVVKYVDMPLQHISDTVLRRMGRRMNETKTRALLRKMRERIPGLYLRTTFIVGFPGESEEEFETLRGFIEEFRFERLGVFPYSSEETTPAAGFAGQVGKKVIEKRLEELMLTQQRIAFSQNRERRGEVVDVLVDSLVDDCDHPPAALAKGRSHGEAPEIDPCVFLTEPKGSASDPSPGEGSNRENGFKEIPLLGRTSSSRVVRPGEFVRARIVGSCEYDVIAVPL